MSSPFLLVPTGYGGPASVRGTRSGMEVRWARTSGPRAEVRQEGQAAVLVAFEQPTPQHHLTVHDSASTKNWTSWPTGGRGLVTTQPPSPWWSARGTTLRYTTTAASRGGSADGVTDVVCQYLDQWGRSALGQGSGCLSAAHTCMGQVNVSHSHRQL
jgi:hypothetical protein